MKYIPGLDGIRALSVLAVIFFHLGIPIFGLGWAGVDCFFVLSGFLITGILIDSKDSQRYFRNFYIKRGLRIFPIYYLVVLVVFLFFQYNPAFKKSVVYYLTYTQNFFFVKVGYGTVPQLAHTWSLAIEEQFYLLWPLVIWKLSVKRIAKLSLILIFGAFVFRTICAAAHGNVYLQNSLLFSHMDALAFGSLLTCLIRLDSPKEQIFKSVRVILISFVCLSLICAVLYVLYSGNGIYTAMEVFSSKRLLKEVPVWNFIYTLIALFFASFIGFVVVDVGYPLARKVRWFLETKPMRHIGKISYGLYLYHLPCFYLVENPWLKVGLTYAVSLLSWYLIESRLNAFKNRFK